MLCCAGTFIDKFIILVAREKRLRRLLDITRCEMFNRDNLKYEKIIDSYAWKGIFHHVAYQSFGTVAVLCWGFAPVANLVSGRSRRLPMEGWYPLNVTASPAYEVISMHQGLSVFIACFHNVAIDTFVTGLLTVACCQLKLLQWNLTLVHDDEEQEPPSSNVNKLLVAPRVRRQIIYNKFKKCLEHSNIIYKFTRNIQSTFGTVIFIQLFVNCIIICLIAFHISQMKIYIPSVLIGMLTYMCCMTYQIFIYCWHGNELHLHAMDLALANYSCNWFESTNEFKRALQIMMIRTQRPLRLSAGNIMVLNLNTFMGIIRTSYSIFTVLQSSTNN
ncbi:odorant receptor 10-like isoform X2 [Prorops nasuta]|uniref:odorant receptor 10-like isoform X2 n=1 Tax=Prorops nasuta TaxID=863751 RepID=UPI0034CFBEF0